MSSLTLYDVGLFNPRENGGASATGTDEDGNVWDFDGREWFMRDGQATELPENVTLSDSARPAGGAA